MTARSRFSISELPKLSNGPLTVGRRDGCADSRTAHRARHRADGTVAYMTPEQVRGLLCRFSIGHFCFWCGALRDVDRQSGLLGTTSADTIAAILHGSPPSIAASVVDLPTSVERIVERCLEKDASGRFQSTADLAFSLRGSEHARKATCGRCCSWAPLVAGSYAGLGALLVTGLVSAGAFALARPGKPAPPTFKQSTFQRGFVQNARFTPDGQSVVVRGGMEW